MNRDHMTRTVEQACAAVVDRVLVGAWNDALAFIRKFDRLLYGDAA